MKEDELDEEDDLYDDDNDFEPFETSKKDFYNGESVDAKTNRTASDAKSVEVVER